MRELPGHPAVPLLLVGNDVVDLDHRNCRGKSDDLRFLDRVLAPAERTLVAAAPDPDHALWLHWAAKEAAFKVVTKLLGEPPVFVHAAFGVEPERGGDRGLVRYEGQALPWRVEPVRDRCLHLFAWNDRGAGGGERGQAVGPAGEPPPIETGIARLDEDADIPRERFSERECAAIHSAASAWVRIHARAALARKAGIAEDRVEIVCDPGPSGRTPPRALVDGRPSAWDVSLSHHGRWLAWALTSAAPAGDPAP